jgi:hypothetical protein
MFYFGAGPEAGELVDHEAQARARLEALREVWRRAELSPALPREGGAAAPPTMIVEGVDPQDHRAHRVDGEEIETTSPRSDIKAR